MAPTHKKLVIREGDRIEILMDRMKNKATTMYVVNLTHQSNDWVYKSNLKLTHPTEVEEYMKTRKEKKPKAPTTSSPIAGDAPTTEWELSTICQSEADRTSARHRDPPRRTFWAFNRDLAQKLMKQRESEEKDPNATMVVEDMVPNCQNTKSCALCSKPIPKHVYATHLELQHKIKVSGSVKSNELSKRFPDGLLFEDDDIEESVKAPAKPKAKKSFKKEIVQAKLFDDEDDLDDGFPSDDDDDETMHDDFGSDSDVDDEDDADDLPIEKKAKSLDKKNALIAAEGDAETRLNIGSQKQFELPSVEDVEKEMKEAPNLQVLKDRIRDVIQVLGDFKNRRQDGKSRSEYVEILTKDLCNQYGYNEYLMGKFMELFPIWSELLEFLDANDQPRPVTIRTNTLKSRRADLAKALINRGMNVDPAATWTKVGLVVYDSQVPVGATPEYLAGHYMIQGLNSLLPVMALAPQPGERVLDMCSAPGGKTSHIAALMKNNGVLFANDANHQRCKDVIGNLHRLGVKNAVISNLNGEKYCKIAPNGFDRVLLDAPCSGTGVIWKDTQDIQDNQDIQRKYTVQRKLILSALDAIDAKSPTGGYVVYSTCSVLCEENEAVVNYALQKRHCELVPTGLDIGVEGFTEFQEYMFHPSMSMTRRYFPHMHNIDGFFVAKIKKLSNAKMGKSSVDIEKIEKLEQKKEEQKMKQKMHKKKGKGGEDSDSGSDTIISR